MAEYLLEKGIPKHIVEAVRLLTKPEDEEYESYLRRVKENPLAKQLKFLVLKCPNIVTETIFRWQVFIFFSAGVMMAMIPYILAKRRIFISVLVAIFKRISKEWRY